MGKYVDISSIVQKLSAGDCIDIVMEFKKGKPPTVRAAVVTEASYKGGTKKGLLLVPGSGGCKKQVDKDPATTVKVRAGIYRFLVERSPMWSEALLF